MSSDYYGGIAGDMADAGDDGDDRYDEYKDGVAMGYINEDGSQREPDESAYLEQKAEQDHSDEVHGGGRCDCPPPTKESMDAWLAQRDHEHREQEHNGGECNCPPEEAPF
jgi:hypothetical protein